MSQDIFREPRKWEVILRPRFEGCNVGTWIGFKHIMYLAEEAVVQWFRDHNLSPGDLLEHFALSLEIVQGQLRLIQGIRIDDEVICQLTPTTRITDKELSFKVELLRKDAAETKFAIGKIRVMIVKAAEFAENAAAAPAHLQEFIHTKLLRGELQQLHLPSGCNLTNVKQFLREQRKKSFIWQWQVPYFYCHNTYRLQYSGYIRLLEQVVDFFLQERGIGITTLLYDKNYNWIPVVSAVKIEMLAEVKLGETLFIVFTVEEVVRDISYSAGINCYVWRNEKLFKTATGTISHAYIAITDRRVGTKLATFTDRVNSALLGDAIHAG